MARREVTCINKNDRTSPYERITHIGGQSANVTRWKVSSSEAIENIERGRDSYFVKKSGHEVEVIVASRNGVKYLRTKNDGDTPDNLLSLPECP